MGGFLLAIALIIVFIVIIATAIRAIKIQHEGRIGLVEAWGRYNRILLPGRYFLLPWERVSGELPLQIFEFETPAQKLVLKGGAPLTLSAIVYYQIEHAHKTPGAPAPARIIGRAPAPLGTPVAARPAPRVATVPGPGHGIGMDSLEPGTQTQAQRRAAQTTRASALNPTVAIRRVLGRSGDQLDIHHAAYRAKYMVHDWREATEKEAVAAMQQVFSKVSVADDIFGDLEWQENLGEKVREHLTEKTERWGVQIIDVAFKDVTFSEMTLANMHAEPRATREGRIRAMEAENYQRIAEMLHLTPAQLLSWRQIEIMRELAKSPQPRVMFTTPVMDHNMGGVPMQSGVAPAGDGNGAQAASDYRGYLGMQPPPPALNAGPAMDRGVAAAGAGGVPRAEPSLPSVEQH